MVLPLWGCKVYSRASLIPNPNWLLAIYSTHTHLRLWKMYLSKRMKIFSILLRFIWKKVNYKLSQWWHNVRIIYTFFLWFHFEKHKIHQQLNGFKELEFNMILEKTLQPRTVEAMIFLWSEANYTYLIHNLTLENICHDVIFLIWSEISNLINSTHVITYLDDSMFLLELISNKSYSNNSYCIKHSKRIFQVSSGVYISMYESNKNCLPFFWWTL